jgi:hypothetical protein
MGCAQAVRIEKDRLAALKIRAEHGKGAADTGAAAVDAALSPPDIKKAAIAVFANALQYAACEIAPWIGMCESRLRLARADFKLPGHSPDFPLIEQGIALTPAALTAILALEEDLSGDLREHILRNLAG